MSQKANYFKIGVFVIGAMVLGAVGLVMLGLRSRLQERILFETYIDESVQGLEVGSPVKYRGVRVGEVKSIDLSPRNREDLRPHGGRLINVVMELRAKALGIRRGEEPTQQELDGLIDRGLRVRLAAQGITGVMYLETDYIEGDKKPFRPPDPTYLYIPSAPSTFTRFTDAMQTIFRKLEHVEFDKLGEQVEQLVTSVNRVVETDKIDRLLASVDQVILNANRKIEEIPVTRMVAQVDEVLGRVKGTLDGIQVEQLRASLGELLDEARTTNRQLQQVLHDVNTAATNAADASKELPPLAAQARSTFRHLNQIVMARQEDIGAIMENVRLITEHLRELSSGAERYPSQVLFGVQPNVPQARRP